MAEVDNVDSRPCQAGRTTQDRPSEPDRYRWAKCMMPASVKPRLRETTGLGRIRANHVFLGQAGNLLLQNAQSTWFSQAQPIWFDRLLTSERMFGVVTMRSNFSTISIKRSKSSGTVPTAGSLESLDPRAIKQPNEIQIAGCLCRSRGRTTDTAATSCEHIRSCKLPDFHRLDGPRLRVDGDGLVVACFGIDAQGGCHGTGPHATH